MVEQMERGLQKSAIKILEKFLNPSDKYFNFMRENSLTKYQLVRVGQL